jgi:hypothetical protein
MKNEILLICFDYLPMVTPNSLRWSSIAEYWSDQGFIVHVICSWQPGQPREETMNKIFVYRVGGKFSQKIRQGIMNKYQPIVMNRIEQKKRLTEKQRMIAWTKWLHDITWKKIYWPDYACLWFFNAYKIANELINKYDIKKMITVSFPFTAHLVGYFIKKNSKTTWIVDIIDPSFFPGFPPTNNRLLYSGLNKRMERKIFRRAQAISVLTEPIRKRFSESYPEDGPKINVNPNLLNYQRDTKSSLFADENKIRIVFIGTLNRTARSPEHVLHVFELLLKTRIAQRLELHFFGRVDYCQELFMPYQELINKSIFLHGPVSRKNAIQAMCSADILANIGNANPYQEPSKVVEYVSSGRPIINFVTIQNDSSALILGKYPAALNVFCPIRDEKTGQLDLLVKFIEHPPKVKRDLVEELVRPYQIDSVADAYQRMLDGAGI